MLLSIPSFVFALLRVVVALPEVAVVFNTPAAAGCNRGFILAALPEEISGLASLECFLLDNCVSLAALPQSISGLSSLQDLSANGCSLLANLPEEFSKLAGLRDLSLLPCDALQVLPAGLASLQTLAIGGNVFADMQARQGDLK